MKATFLPMWDQYSIQKPKSYFSRTNQTVEIIRALKSGLYLVRTEDGFEFESPLRYLKTFEETT